MSTTATTSSPFKKLLRYGPSGLVIAAAALLCLQAVLVSKYYSDMFPAHIWNADWRTWLAGFASVTLKTLAFFLLFLTVKNFSDGRRTVGKWGIAATTVLNLYFLLECHFMATLWSGTGENYWHIFPFLFTITVMVLFVEWRLAATTNADAIEENAIAQAEKQAADDRKLILELTGKLNRLEAEKREQEDRKQAEQQRLAELEAAEAERRKQEEYDDLRKQLAAARRELTKVETMPGGKIKISTDKVSAAIRDFMRKNTGVKPTQTQIAAILKTTERTLRNTYQNGSWDTIIDELFRDINHTQPETTTI